MLEEGLLDSLSSQYSSKKSPESCRMQYVITAHTLLHTGWLGAAQGSSCHLGL